MQLTSVIIDDEQTCRDSLQVLLTALHPEIAILGLADSVQSGLSLIERQQPDVLFLDIELPDGTGFDLLEKIDAGRFATVFVTAHSIYAQRAFDFEAMAYLNKPVAAEKLSFAISRARERLLQRTYQQQLADLREVIENYRQEKLPTRLAVSNNTGIHYIPVSDITFLTVDQGCTEIHQANGSRIMVSANLVEYERRFAAFPNFLKVHKSYILNLDYVSTYRNDGEVVLRNGQVVPVSQRHQEELKAGLGRVSV